MLDDSLIKSNFVGRDGFIWWIGQIPPESSHGQQINGSGWGNRYKVRIMGYHPYSEADLKNEDLPWAQVLLPTTAGSGGANRATSVRISPGDVVFGFFLDGDNAQIPVIFGTFGRTDQVPSKDYRIPFLPYTGRTDKIKHDGKNLDKGEENEQNAGSQKSPRHVSPAQASEIEDNRTGKEISYFSGIGDKIYFASQSSQGVIGKMITEVDNFISAVQNGVKKVSDLINIVVDKIQSIVTGLVGSMVDAVYRKLAPLLNKGLKILYEIVFKLVFAATQNTTIAHLAGVAAQTAMVPPIQKIQDILPGLVNTIIASLAGLIKRLLRSVLGNMKNFTTCASNQFVGSLVNDIIQKISNGLKGVLGGVSKILSLVGGFDPAGFLRSTPRAIAGIANLFSFKESIFDYSKPTNQWIIGRGPNEQLGPSFKDILKSANESAKLTANAFKSAVSDIKGGANEIGNAFDDFSKKSKSSKSKCYTGKKLKCGGPKVRIFGGGGKGAKAVALVGAVVGTGKNRAGSVVGIKIKNKGKKYRFPPFVEIVDECNLGRGAICRSVINENGEVTSIYVVSEGENYPIDEFTELYVNEVEVIDAGSDYSDGDYGVDQFGNTYIIEVSNGFIDKVIPNITETIIDPVIPNEDSSIGEVGISDRFPQGPGEGDLIDTGTTIDGVDVSTIPSGTEIDQIFRNRRRVVRRVNRQPTVDDLPEITIISETGSGAILNPILDNVPYDQFIRESSSSIDCVD